MGGSKIMGLCMVRKMREYVGSVREREYMVIVREAWREKHPRYRESVRSEGTRFPT